ncbi:MAG: hypothetical protein IBX52_02245 [Bacterioplanes sp.]|nr:hypothetical protein [Bacterioplanes sp.]
MADKKRDHTIPADQATAAKPWRLPFWTETPQWAIERDRAEAEEQAAAEQSVRASTNDEMLSFPTAEELENIRRDAYNAGLEQGLVEGRQQGYQEGLMQGLTQGKSDGYQQGYQQGQQEGRTAGEQQGLQAGQATVDQQVQQINGVLLQLQRTLLERDQALPEVLSELIRFTCEQVLEHELKSGAAGVQSYIEHALQQLPMGKDAVQVFVSSADHALLTKLPSVKHRAVDVLLDEQLDTGHVRVETEDSLIEYASRQRLEQALDHLQPMLLKACQDFPDIEEQEQAVMDGMAECGRRASAEEARSKENNAAQSDAEQNHSAPHDAEQDDAEEDDFEQDDSEQDDIEADDSEISDSEISDSERDPLEPDHAEQEATPSPRSEHEPQ